MPSPSEQKSQEDHLSPRREVAELTLVGLFKGKTPQEWRAAYSGAYDWGPDIGREIVVE